MFFRRKSAEEKNSVQSVEKPRLRDRLKRSNFSTALKAAFSRTDVEVWQGIEEALLLADVGIETTQSLVKKVRQAVSLSADEQKVREVLHRELVALLEKHSDRDVHARTEGMSVVLVVGVNGTGKTTTTGKLAHRWTQEGNKVLLGAADTFRAAAAEQLATWAQRSGSELVRGADNADPAAVAFDAVARGLDLGVDVVLLDTAGRLHTKQGLMDELSKIQRIVEKRAQVDEVLLVIDATTGQNGLNQASVFAQAVNITGLVLTKLDGSARGGIVIAVQEALGVPVKYVGVGEGADDLLDFDADDFVSALLAE